MHRFKNILCVVNPDEKTSAVVRRASELATLHGTKLTLVHVVEDMPGLDPISDGDLVSTPLHGNPAQEIVKQVLRGKHDLLIKPVEISGNGTARVATTDKYLLRQCPCPVWLFKPTRHNEREQILAAVDSDLNGSIASLNELVLDFSTSLADEEHAQLHAVSSWGVRGEQAMRSRIGTLAIRRLLAGVRRANMRWIRRLTEPYAQRGARFHVHMKKGKQNEAILAEAKKRRPDLIVMGTTGRVGIAEFLFGTAPEQILSRVDCSVLAVKPKEFVSEVDA